jgi:hypothetical protein
MIHFKKSQIGTTLTLIAATIIIFFLLFFFLSVTNIISLFKFSSSSSQSENQIPSSQIESIEAYLNTESSIAGEKTKIWEMIRLWSLEGNSDYLAKIQQETDNIFSVYSNGDEKCYFLKIQSGANLIQSGNIIKDDPEQGVEHVLYLSTLGSEQIKISFRLDEKCMYNWE